VEEVEVLELEKVGVEEVVLEDIELQLNQ